MKDRIKKFVKENEEELATGIAVGVISGLMALIGYQYGRHSVGVEYGAPYEATEDGQRQFLVILDNGKDILFTEPKK